MLPELRLPGSWRRLLDLITQITARLRVHVVADAAYHGKPLQTLPPEVTFTTRLPRTAVLNAPAPPPTGRRGRPRKRGTRSPRPALGRARALTGKAVLRWLRAATVLDSTRDRALALTPSGRGGGRCTNGDLSDAELPSGYPRLRRAKTPQPRYSRL